jgi:hypothetical protein
MRPTSERSVLSDRQVDLGIYLFLMQQIGDKSRGQRSEVVNLEKMGMLIIGSSVGGVELLTRRTLDRALKNELDGEDWLSLASSYGWKSADENETLGEQLFEGGRRSIGGPRSRWK